MKKEEILKKAIAKAERNGYKFWHVDPKHIRFIEDENIFQYKKSPYNYYAGVYETIFSHNFAQAYFGFEGIKDWPCDYKVISEEKCKIPAWQYHLQQMVLSDDPITYLEQYLSQ